MVDHVGYYDPTQLEVFRGMSRGQKNLHLGLYMYMSKDNTLDVTEDLKKKLLDLLGIKESTYRTTISELHKLDIIRILGRNVYMLNPMLVFKCELYEQKKLIDIYKKMEE